MNATKYPDPLQYLPLEKLSELQEAFKSDWPRGISGYTILETQRSWKEEGLDYGFKVFCPFGDVMNGMVAVNEKGTFYEVVIQCPKDDTIKLEDALKDTKVIDWDKGTVIPFAPRHVIECIKRIVKHINVNIELILPSDSFIMDKRTALFKDFRFPPDITFGHLSPKHVELIDSKWPHRYPGSLWYIHLLIKSKSGYGLFKDKELVSWVFVNEAGTLGQMFTLEEHRRRGYAEMLLKTICNILLGDGKYVFAFSVKGNDSACKLYPKIGFKQYDCGVAWCCLKRSH